MTRRLYALPSAALAALFCLAACGGESEAPPSPDDAAASTLPEATDDNGSEPGAAPPAEPGDVGPPEGSLAWALAGEWRPPAARARDEGLAPEAVLAFLGLEPGQTVLHAWPDSYYPDILSPYLHANDGTYVMATPVAWGENGEAAECDARADDPLLAPCPHARVVLNEASGALAAPGSVDLALSIRSVHAWMALGVAEKAMADIFVALRPGGAFAVIEARAPDGPPQDPGAASGYVQEAYVRLLAEEAGFEAAGASDLGQNLRDDAEHPFGVWTLAPHNRTSPLWEPADPDFDRSAFDEIGEPDRMILVFRKPAESDETQAEDADAAPADDASTDDETGEE